MLLNTVTAAESTDAWITDIHIEGKILMLVGVLSAVRRGFSELTRACNMTCLHRMEQLRAFVDETPYASDLLVI